MGDGIGRHGSRYDIERWGYFAEMSHMHGAKYTQPVVCPNVRDMKGRQMYPGGTKIKCGLQDCYFDPEFKRIFTKEALTETIKLELKERKEALKRNIAAQPFLAGGATKKQSTPGDNYGTFTFEPIPAFSPKTFPKKKQPTEARNLLGNPGKKGGPGYVDITIGPYPPHADEKYYISRKRTAQEERVTPFFGRGPVGYFDPNPYISEQKGSTYRMMSEVKVKPNYGPFYPSKPTASLGGGMFGCFDAWPEHSRDVYVPPYKVEKYDKNKKNKEVNPNVNPAQFYPQARNKSKATCSVMQRKIDIRMNSKTWRVMRPQTYTREFF